MIISCAKLYMYMYIVGNSTQFKWWTVEKPWSIFRCRQTTVAFSSERLDMLLQYSNYWCMWHACDRCICWSTKVAVGLEWMWWESVTVCYFMPLKDGMQKQWDWNIAAVTGKESKSTIVTHGTIRVKCCSDQAKAKTVLLLLSLLLSLNRPLHIISV